MVACLPPCVLWFCLPPLLKAWMRSRPGVSCGCASRIECKDLRAARRRQRSAFGDMCPAAAATATGAPCMLRQRIVLCASEPTPGQAIGRRRRPSAGAMMLAIATDVCVPQDTRAPPIWARAAAARQRPTGPDRGAACFLADVPLARYRRLPAAPLAGWRGGCRVVCSCMLVADTSQAHIVVQISTF